MVNLSGHDYTTAYQPSCSRLCTIRTDDYHCAFGSDACVPQLLSWTCRWKMLPILPAQSRCGLMLPNVWSSSARLCFLLLLICCSWMYLLLTGDGKKTNRADIWHAIFWKRWHSVTVPPRKSLSPSVGPVLLQMFASGGIWLFPVFRNAPMCEAAEPTNERKEPTSGIQCIFSSVVMECQTEAETLTGSIKVAFVFQVSFIAWDRREVYRENIETGRHPECICCCLVFCVAVKLNIDQIISANSAFFRLLALIVTDGCTVSTSRLVNWNNWLEGK